MSSLLRSVLLGLVGLSGLTGLVFAIMKYLMTSDDPFAAFHHPWQPWMLSGHLLVAPLLLFTLGWVFASHVIPHLSGVRRARLSGLAVLITIVVMTGSGYLLQVASEPAWRRGYAWIHGISGTLFLGSIAAHWLFARGQSIHRRHVRPAPDRTAA